MADTVFIFSIVAAVIVVGFAGELFFRKTGIPAFVFLILMGILIGPVLGLLSRTSLLPSLGVFAELTLLMVLFYGGMDTQLGAALKGGGRALLQVAIYVIGSTIAIAALVSFFLGWDLISSLIFASMVGGETTAAVVIPLSRSLKLPEVTVAFLTLESAMNSIFSIILFFAFVGVYQTGAANWFGALQTVASNFSVGIVLGAVVSVGWVLILNRFKERKYTYVLTLGFVFATYVASARLGGSGELSVLIFGIVLGNYGLLNGFLNWHLSMDVLQRKLGLFQEEISFLMETLFFVFLGLTFQIASSQISANLAIGVGVLVVLLLFRTASTAISTKGSDLQQSRRAIILMCAQGLVPATLAIIAVNLALPHSESYLNIVTYVIILTNVVTAIGGFTRLRNQKLAFKDFMGGLNGQSFSNGHQETACLRDESCPV
jgi:cell volume regulation protein A